MSLVSEALRKARLEAARQEARRRGLPPPPGPEPRPRRGPGNAVLAVAVLAGLLAGALIFWAGRHSAAPPQTAVAAAPAPEAAVAAPSEPPPVPAERAATAPPTRAAGRAAEETAPPPVPAAPTNPAPSRPSRPEADPRPPRAAAPPRSEPVETGPAVYLSEADVEGGRLELGGIAFSQDRPFALINGEVVGPGDRLLGHTVVAILPESVELEGPGGVLILRLR